MQLTVEMTSNREVLMPEKNTFLSLYPIKFMYDRPNELDIDYKVKKMTIKTEGLSIFVL